jgi:1-phosphofructokinase
VILTVTLNPAIDRTIWVDQLKPGELHRAARSSVDAAGKGINVSRALRRWGMPTEIVAVLGGRTGEAIQQALLSEGLEGCFLPAHGESRTNVKVVEAPTGRMTEFNEMGPPMGPAGLDRVIQALSQRLERADWLVLSGSLPRGTPPEAYQRIIEAARRARPGMPVALDASGEALRLGLAAAPGLIKPNRHEMEELLNRPLPDLKAWKEAALEVQAAGVERVVLSLGADGALFAAAEGCYWAKSKPVEVKSPTGCGDTLLAATLYALGQKRAWEECARFAVAAATAAAMLPGTQFPALEEIGAALAGVTVRRV